MRIRLKCPQVFNIYIENKAARPKCNFEFRGVSAIKGGIFADWGEMIGCSG